MINKIIDTMRNNTTLGKYDLRFNMIEESEAEKLISCIEQNKNIYVVTLSDHLPPAILDKIKSLTKKRKPKKKKGKKKKK